MNYIDHLLIVTSKNTGCASISTFASLLFGIVMTSFAIELKIFIITAGIKKYKSIIKKIKKKHNKIALLAKSKLNSVKFLISMAFTDSDFTHDKLILMNNPLKEFYGIQEEIKKLEIVIISKSLNYI